MTLGEKIRQARLEAGLSQRQLCGDTITRNMLSQIENGTARPSMDTLRFLAARLGKTVSFFLEEDAVLSPNQQVMVSARQAADRGDWMAVRKTLEEFREPDDLFHRERQLLEVLSVLELAEQALENGKEEYARQLLEEADREDNGYHIRELERRRLLLLAKAAPEKRGRILRELPSLDEELLLRAGGALDQGDAGRSGALLEAMEDKTAPQWHYLRGEVHLAAGQFTRAAVCFLRAESALPESCWPKLERCYRELGNYEKAYEYACKQK